MGTRALPFVMDVISRWCREISLHPWSSFPAGFRVLLYSMSEGSNWVKGRFSRFTHIINALFPTAVNLPVYVCFCYLMALCEWVTQFVGKVCHKRKLAVCCLGPGVCLAWAFQPLFVLLGTVRLSHAWKMKWFSIAIVFYWKIRLKHRLTCCSSVKGNVLLTCQPLVSVVTGGQHSFPLIGQSWGRLEIPCEGSKGCR